MSRQKYTHVQELLPEIRAMEAAGKTKRERRALPNISQAYFDLTKEYGITPSMSSRGNCYDNAMAENFFSILKTECIYRHHSND